MATIQHKDIPNADLHEPKGVSAAVTKKVYVSNGSGSGAWDYPFVHGSTAFVDLATPSTLTTPTSYTKAAPTTTNSSASVEFTEATNGRLTYTGTRSRRGVVRALITLDQTAGATRPVNAAIYKNGSVIAATVIQEELPDSGMRTLTLMADTAMATNDYFEVYVKITGTGNVRIYALNLMANGFL
jgi:hypothetical protein